MSESTDAVAMRLDHKPVKAEFVVEGSPTTGCCDLITLGDLTVGVWEHTAGISRDVESDEVFVVLGGAATVSFDDGSPAIELRSGTVARLCAGQRTTWTVREALRKVFIA